MANKHISRCKTYPGWHSSSTGKMGITRPSMASEGVGYYVAFDKETAEGFGRKVRPVELTLCKPLDARGETPHLLYESEDMLEKPKRSDSVWLSSIKEAVKKSGTTKENWGTNFECLTQTLTDVLQEKGYDGMLIGDWGVEFARPRERANLKGCKVK